MMYHITLSLVLTAAANASGATAPSEPFRVGDQVLPLLDTNVVTYTISTKKCPA